MAEKIVKLTAEETAAIGSVRAHAVPPLEDFRMPKQKPAAVRESHIEKYGSDKVRLRRGLPYKFTSPGRRSVPDRLNLYEVAPEHRAIVALYVKFVEYKKPGEKPTPPQLREHELLRSKGYEVLVIDTKEQADQLL